MFEKKLLHTLRILPYLVGQEAVSFFEERITKGVSVRNVPFKKRKFDTKSRQGRAVLIKSGALRRSIRISKLTANSVTVTSDMPYSQIHNEGGEVPITPKMRKFFWAKYYEAGGRIKTNKQGNARNTKSNAQANKEAGFWKAMALKKTNIKIPKRQFMGDTKFLEVRIKKLIEAEIKKATS